MSENFYITTTLPYVNAAPHLGFAWEILTADIIARDRRARGQKVVFNTGTDEHGQKIWEKARERGMTPQQHVDEMSQNFRDLRELLDISYTNFIRTTDAHHMAAAQEMWRRCAQRGDIYKKKYAVKYCVGCELAKTESELVDGRCPLHPDRELEVREEDNYFFRFSRYQQPLLDFYASHPDFVIGEGKQSEIVAFVKNGLQDFSISRVATAMPWGIPVPDDDTQVMYVWFDALTNYIATLGWPEETSDWDAWWPGVQTCGKDNLRQQAATWQAMLMSAGLPNSQHILVNGFISVDGQKMSKSLGNVIAPGQLVDRNGREATRLILAGLPVWSGDVDITWARLDEWYTAHLVNGLGNLASRLAKLASTCDDWQSWRAPEARSSELLAALEKFDTSGGLQTIIDRVSRCDAMLSEKKPWLINDNREKVQVLSTIGDVFLQAVADLSIYMPEASECLLAHFTAPAITPLTPMFPRLAKH